MHKNASGMTQSSQHDVHRNKLHEKSGGKTRVASVKVRAKDELMRTGLPELIPENVGSGLHRKQVQNRALATWSSLGAIAVYTFYQKPFGLSAPSRAAILGLVFPGAGYVACGNWLGWGLLVLTILTQPFVLFAVRSSPSPLPSLEAC